VTRNLRVFATRLAIAASLGLLYLGCRFDQQKLTGRLGKIESWSEEFPFSHEQRAEVLVTGLGEIRGLADHNGRILMADANGRVPRYAGELEEGRSKDEPANVDQRGAAVDGNLLFIAQYDQGRISTRNLQTQQDLPGIDLTDVSGPSGIAVAGATLYVTDDRPWRSSTDSKSSDSPGAVLACPKSGGGSCSPVAGSRLQHPSGIALDDTGTFLFVTESDAAQVRWAVFQKITSTWIEAGALGSARVAGEVLPPFVGIAFGKPDPAKPRSYVFAAGPNSLDVFSWPRPSQMLGRVVFEEPVSGVVVHDKLIYLVVGHRLCRLTMDNLR
jgi:hypothetical protein